MLKQFVGKNRKIFELLVGFVLLLAYLIFLVFCIRRYGELESDSANMVLEAADIVRGNFFMNNWALSGITFITTDLPYFVLGVALFGVGAKAYYFAAALMQCVLVGAVGVYLYSKLRNKRFIIVYIVMMFCPSVQELGFFRVHIAVFTYLFLAIIFAEKFMNCLDKKKQRLYFAGMCIAIMLGAAGDAIILLGAVIPIFIISFVRWLRGIAQKKDALLILGATVGTIAGIVVEKLYLLGGADKQSYLTSERVFENYDMIPKKIFTYIEGSLRVFNADFGGKVLGGYETIIQVFNLILACVGLLLIIINIYRLIRKETYYFEAGISLGICILSLVIIFTSIMIDWTGLRYVSYIRLASIVLILLYVDQVFKDRKVQMCRYSICIFVYALMYLLVNRVGLHSLQDIQKSQQERLSEYLLDQGYESGYAINYWDSSEITVLTNEKVTVRAVERTNGITEARWMSKNDWYDKEANFVIVREYEYESMKAMLEEAFGEADEVESYENYKILSYDYDISGELNEPIMPQ